MTVAACFAFQRDTSSSVLVTTEVGYAKDFRFCPDTRLSPRGSARLKGCREQTLRFPKNEREVGFPYRGRRGDNCRVGNVRIHCVMSGSAITSASSSILKVESNVAFIFGSNVLLNKATYANGLERPLDPL